MIDNLRLALASGSPQALEVAEEGLRTWPSDPEMLLLAALTALAGNLPERALALLKRYGKRYVPGKAVTSAHGPRTWSATAVYPGLDDAARCRAGY